jgi:hypothetical protein
MLDGCGVIAGAWSSLLMPQMIDNQLYDGKLKNLKKCKVEIPHKRVC